MAPVRYIGIDIHKRQVVVAAVNSKQELILSPRKVSVSEFEAWADTHLLPTDHITLEATANAWEFHDLLSPMVSCVQVANSHKLRLISASSRKTDKHDALVLAKLLAAHLLPAVWVPPQHVRELRQLTRHRSQLVSQKSSVRNRLHAILHRHNLKAPKGQPFSLANEQWWTDLPLSPVEQLQVRHYWQTLHHLSQLITETETMIAQFSVADEWAEPITFLIQMSGIGLYSGMTILAAIGDISRFPAASQLVGYAGLGARVRESGDTLRTGGISKQGRRELRTILITCAWLAVHYSDYWRSVFQPLAHRIGKHKAITAVARKMLVAIWYILTQQETDRHADPETVARSFMNWASLHHLARSQNLHRLDFVRQRLRLIGLSDRVTSFQANGRTHHLVPAT